MKKTTFSIGFIILFVFYVLYQRLNSPRVALVAPQRFGQNSVAVSAGNIPAAAATPLPTPASSSPVVPPAQAQTSPAPARVSPSPAPKPAGLYKDGEYTGNIADAYYGNVQVKAIIQGGKIADVQFLDHPHDRRTSQAINSQAMPYLTQEAIQAQNANVDTISGATFTSQAFIESLTSALLQAKN